MTPIKFFGLLFLTGCFHYMSFMGVAFAFAGMDGNGAPESTAKVLRFFVNVGDFLLQMHLYWAPIYYVATVGVFFLGSRVIASQLAKWSWALPMTSFVTIFLFFFIMSRLKK